MARKKAHTPWSSEPVWPALSLRRSARAHSDPAPDTPPPAHTGCPRYTRRSRARPRNIAERRRSRHSAALATRGTGGCIPGGGGRIMMRDLDWYIMILKDCMVVLGIYIISFLFFSVICMLVIQPLH